MYKKGSMWMLLSVALGALSLMALIGLANGASGTTGDMANSMRSGSIVFNPNAHPTPPHPVPLNPTVNYPVQTVVYDNSDTRAMAGDMEQVRRATCFTVNFELDRDAGRHTPPEQISTMCPSYI